MSIENPRRVITREVRLSYVKLANPEPGQNGEMGYSVVLLIPKSDTVTKAAIDKAIAASIEQAVAKKWGGIRPANIKTILHDGDGVKSNGKPYEPECKGCWVLNAKRKESDGKPYICHASDRNTPISPLEVYSGSYGFAIVEFWGYSRSGNNGISCTIVGIAKSRDGEVLGGAVAPSAAAFDGADFGQSYTPGIGSAVPAGVQINPITGLPM